MSNDDFDDDLLALIREAEREHAIAASRVSQIPQRLRQGEERDAKTIAFLDFLRGNIGVYHQLVRFAREAQAAGYERYGISDILGRVRWETSVVERVDPESEFKINDHTRPYFSRLVMEAEPSLRGMFSVRECAGDDDDWMAEAIQVVKEVRAA